MPVSVAIFCPTSVVWSKEEVLRPCVVWNRDATLKSSQFWSLALLASLLSCLSRSLQGKSDPTSVSSPWVYRGEKLSLLSVHLGLDAQAGMGVLCHLGRATGSTSEVDGSWFMASSLHTVMSAGCIPTRPESQCLRAGLDSGTQPPSLALRLTKASQRTCLWREGLEW